MCSQDDKLTRSSDDLTIDNLDEETLDQALALPHPTEETVDRVEWNAEAEGYTPLADANMNAFAGGMFMTMPPAEEGDTGVFFADMSAFPSSPYATITQYDDDDSDGCASLEEQTNDIDISLAEQALRALDEDYSMTLSGHIPENLENAQAKGSEGLNSAQLNVAGANGNDEEAKVNFDDAEFGASRKMSSELELLQPKKLPKKDLPPIDTDAVRRAVAAIQLRDPKLKSNLDKWQNEHCYVLAPKEHPIIPPLPLSAFRKRTAKAKLATANLSRAATIADALNRICCLKGQEVLSIHVIGADHVECASNDILRTLFGPLVRWIGAMDNHAPRSIEIHLIGPNLTNEMVTAPVNLMPSSKLKNSSPLVSAYATCHIGAYHEWVSGTKPWKVPDLLVAFNAGIWGYNDWKPTLEALCRMPWPAILVVTSYTLEEGEDDADVIGGIFAAFNSSKRNHCLWSVDTNPYSSRMKRETATAIEGREYRENAAWQAWRFD